MTCDVLAGAWDLRKVLRFVVWNEAKALTPVRHAQPSRVAAAAALCNASFAGRGAAARGRREELGHQEPADGQAQRSARHGLSVPRHAPRVLLA